MAGAASGGAEMACVDMCIAQKEAGFDVHLACRPNAQRDELLLKVGVKLLHLPFGKLLDFKTSAVLRQYIKSENIQLVQTWMSRASSKTPKVSGVPMISRLGGYYKMKYYRNSDFFIANTPDIARYIKDQGVEPKRIVQINNFAEIEDLESAKPLDRSAQGTPENAFLYLAMARLHPVKGIDTLLKAIAKTDQNIHVWIAGDGPEKDNLLALRDELGLQDRVKFLGWRTDRAALLKTCNAVVFTSRFEPFGGTFAQAWAANKPLITTASEGPSQFVADGQDAIVVPIDDVEMLADRMDGLAKDEALQVSFSVAGRSSYEGLFTQDIVMKKTKEFYKTCLKSI